MAFDDVAKSMGLSAEQVASIPEDLRSEKSLEPIKDFGGLVKSFADGQKFIGNSIRVPKEDAKPEEWAAVHAKLGRPESPDKYNLTLPRPDKIDWQDEKLKRLRETGFGLGFNHQQMHGVLNLYADLVDETEKGIQAGKEAALQELSKDWGPEQSAGYQRNMALVKRAVGIYGEGDNGEKTKEFFNSVTEIGNHPLLVRMIAKMAADLDEADYLGGESGGGGVTPEEAKAKIAEINRDPNDLYHAKNAGKPGHDERVAEVEKLYQLAYPRA
jgi:hypothetical protein